MGAMNGFLIHTKSYVFGILLVRNPIRILKIQLGRFRLFKIDISKIINFDSCIGFKVEKILKGSLDSIPSSSPSVKMHTYYGLESLLEV